jgi:hypothetical protein
MTKLYNTRWPDADKQRARAMFIDGASYTTIGAYFHVSRCSVAGLARREGWRDSDRTPEQRYETPRETINEICDRFLAGESSYRIASSMGMKRGTVQGVLQK